jgi:hypothetical protein
MFLRRRKIEMGRKMFKKLVVVILGVLSVVLIGCKVRTPEIRGVVLDAETKQPVAEAWIHARVQIFTKTVGGGAYEVLSVDRPHTRSDERGEFVIPAWQVETASIPYGFGTKVDYFYINAETIDDWTGGFDLKDYEGKKMIEVIIYVKPLKEMLEEDRENIHSPIYLLYDFPFDKRYKSEQDDNSYRIYLQSLYNYCFWGRFAGGEKPAVKGGCDEWELVYVIAKHERFLEHLGEPKTQDQRISYSILMGQLGYLYKRKGDYKNALDTFEKVLEFDKKRNLNIFLKQYETQIEELQGILGEK